jgi:hypothetical protein
VLSFLAGWTLFAFGGAYSWTTVPLVAGSCGLAIVLRPPPFRRGTRALDLAIAACLIAATLQLVTWPASLRLGVSPALRSMDRALRLDAPRNPASGLAGPLTVDRASGLEWLVLATSIVLFFWCARYVFKYGSMREVIRVVSVCGGVAAGIALLQHTATPHLLYGMWRPLSRNAEFPFSPFVNRNDLAAWMIMALPLSAGYLLARVDARRREGRLSVETVFDGTGVWLVTAICAMAAALVATLSRSGLTAGGAAAVSIVVLSRDRVERRGRAWLVVGLLLLAFVGAT